MLYGDVTSISCYVLEVGQLMAFSLYIVLVYTVSKKCFALLPKLFG